MLQPCSRTFPARRALLRFLAPRSQQHPRPRKRSCWMGVERTGYTHTSAVELLNHVEYDSQTIQRRLPSPVKRCEPPLLSFLEGGQLYVRHPSHPV